MCGHNKNAQHGAMAPGHCDQAEADGFSPIPPGVYAQGRKAEREREGEVDKGPSLVRFSSGKKANETCDSAMNLMRLR